MRLQRQIQPAGKRLESGVAAEAVEDGFGQLLDAHGALLVCLCEPYDRGLAVPKSGVDYGQIDGRNIALSREHLQVFEDLDRLGASSCCAIGIRQKSE